MRNKIQNLMNTKIILVNLPPEVTCKSIKKQLFSQLWKMLDELEVFCLVTLDKNQFVIESLVSSINDFTTTLRISRVVRDFMRNLEIIVKISIIEENGLNIKYPIGKKEVGCKKITTSKYVRYFLGEVELSERINRLNSVASYKIGILGWEKSTLESMSDYKSIGALIIDE